MAIQEIRVWHRKREITGSNLQHEAKRTLGIETGEIKTTRVYWLEGVSKEEASRLGEELFADPVIQEFSVNQPLESPNKKRFTVAYKPGVMDPEAQAIMEAAKILGLNPQAVATSWEYGFPQNLSQTDIERITTRLLANPTVQHLVTEKPKTLIISGEVIPAKIFSLYSYSDRELREAISWKWLALTFDEMRAIQDYSRRIDRGLTDVEIGTLDQTWSEHCGHPTFKGKVIVDGVEKPPLIQRIKETSFKFAEKISSAFVDNAGGIPFYDGMVICAKGETHNFPVSIEPYGGAMTRSGGLFRDIAAMGEGGENLFAFDINCFAPPDMPVEKVPPGCLHPDYLLRHNFYGIRDYGNRMGIPTVRAAFFFHPDYRAKCTSLGITFGIIPEERCQKREPKAGQLILSVGGRTGRDGMFGASYSSIEMSAETIYVHAVAVQIGNPIEEKRVFDALIECRDANLVEVVQDCGGGGYSSAIGEMGRDVGAEVYLEKVKLKYPGLSPEEIWLSEAQERMIIAADPQNLEKLQKIFDKHNVKMTVLGRFTGDKRLTLRHYGEVVCDLDMEFLHYGQPQRVLEAHWEPPVRDERQPDLPSDWNQIFRQVLSHWNVCSQESVIRQYDHGVQGITALSPFTGVHEDVLNDGYVCTPMKGKPYGLVAAHGFYPVLNNINPYWGSIWAVTEALSNFTAVGGNYKEAGLIDNYIWPKPTKKSMGSLDMATDALCDSMELLSAPCVSGKDSLSSTYKSGEETIEIPPVLNISVFGRIPNVEQTTSLDFKKTGSTICLVGNLDKENLAGSVYYDLQGLVGTNLPKVDIENLTSVLDKIHAGIKSGNIMACHDISRGGLAVSLAEMCFGGDCGAKINLSALGETRPDLLLFNETAGCFLAEVDNLKVAKELFDGVPWIVLGQTQEKKEIEVKHHSTTLFASNIDDLKAAWQKPVKGVIG